MASICLRSRLAENRRLKKMYTDERLNAEIVAEAVEKSGSVTSAAGDGAVGRSAAVNHDWPGMLGILWHQPVLLPLQGQAGRGHAPGCGPTTHPT